jgi:hypothetical protein
MLHIVFTTVLHIVYTTTITITTNINTTTTTTTTTNTTNTTYTTTIPHITPTTILHIHPPMHHHHARSTSYSFLLELTAIFPTNSPTRSTYITHAHTPPRTSHLLSRPGT